MLPTQGPWARPLGPYLLVAFLFFATRPYFEGLNNPNEMVRLYAAKAFVDHGDFAIDPVLREWGRVDDKSKREGKRYSSKAPLQTLVDIPCLALAQTLLPLVGIEADKRNLTLAVRIGASTLPVLIFSLVLVAWARRRAVELGASAAWGTASGLSLALGTMLYPFGLIGAGHGLAAICAGGAHLLLVGLVRSPTGSGPWRARLMGLGLASALAPFAEYPAALAVGPALLVVPFVTPGWNRRFEALAWTGLGGALPLALGLWTHKQMWGSPWATGYGFLDNPAYRTLVDDGFFGVVLPRPEALWGALFSPGTGLFFYSPVLLLGLAMVVRSALHGRDASPTGVGRHRWLAVAGLTSVVLMFLFIASHEAWRGGWTLGPRYIIPVAPILGIWLIESLAIAPARPWIAVLGGLSILITGLSAALYPHLSDVFHNPVAHFVWPTYAEGLAPYGLGLDLGLTGWLANAVHGVPLLVATAQVVLTGIDSGLTMAKRWLPIVAGIAIVAVVPEKDPEAARTELARLWSIWEPKPGLAPRVNRQRDPKAIGSLRRAFRQATVRAVHADGTIRRCQPPLRNRCRYGDASWQQILPSSGQIGGRRELGLTLHPIAHGTVIATFPVPEAATQLRMVYGLTDGSVTSPNPTPVDVTVLLDGQSTAQRQAGNDAGWRELILDVTGTASVAVQLEVTNDGARVMMIDGDFTR